MTTDDVTVTVDRKSLSLYSTLMFSGLIKLLVVYFEVSSINSTVVEPGLAGPWSWLGLRL